MRAIQVALMGFDIIDYRLFDEEWDTPDGWIVFERDIAGDTGCKTARLSKEFLLSFILFHNLTERKVSVADIDPKVHVRREITKRNTPEDGSQVNRDLDLHGCQL